jgi:hypothetical protein
MKPSDRWHDTFLLLILRNGLTCFVKSPSVEPVLGSRLLPKVSFRLLLVLMTLAALIAAVGRAAGDGGAVARAAVAGLVFPAACLGLFVVLFLVAWAVGCLWYEAGDERLKGSPFAAGQLPPQLIPPRENKS